MSNPYSHAGRIGRVLALASLLTLLAACENSATAFPIEGSQHALILMREQAFPWDDKLEQALVASRLPQCQKRVAIHPGAVTLEEMKIYQAGDHLWALHQGSRWYLASTERCLVQDWDNVKGEAPGPLLGSFRLKDGAPSFIPAAGN